ncbi:MAG: hypothetical protein CMH73_00840 [Nitrospina sp.]|nr:hypothetical protein [Nitrospina sp.]
MKSIAYLTLFILCTSVTSLLASPSEISLCHKQLDLVKTPREEVASYDGVWGLFQKNKELQNSSVEGINLDKSINSMIFNLEFLCDTIDGIPFDELSDYVTVNLTEKGEEKFRQELIILGKNEEQINVWFEFAKFAVAKRYRVLDAKKIHATIQSAEHFVKIYLELAKRIDRKINLALVIQETQGFTKRIQKFLESDPYLSQAIHENSQIPYADWDENYGGS